MTGHFKKYLAESKAAIPVEFAFILIFYFNLFLILIDLMLVVAQWADVQRANAIVAERIKNRDPTFVTNILTKNFGLNVSKAYYRLLIFNGKASTMAINLSTTTSPRHIPGVEDLQTCFSNTDAFSCGSTQALVAIDPATSAVLLKTKFIPYRVTVITALNNTIFGSTIYASNLVTLSGL